jgi:uncharacterized membrane protein YgcG
MAKFIILFFLIAGGSVSYFTYTGTGQERVETLEKEKSYRSGSSGGGGSYSSGGYSYGK